MRYHYHAMCHHNPIAYVSEASRIAADGIRADCGLTNSQWNQFVYQRKLEHAHSDGNVAIAKLWKCNGKCLKRLRGQRV
jgi:hypothetical protein